MQTKSPHRLFSSYHNQLFVVLGAKRPGRHEVSTLEAEQAILDPNAVMLEIQIEGAEDRVKAVDRTSSGRILVAVFTVRGDAIRPITAYDARIRDQNLYLKGGQYE